MPIYEYRCDACGHKFERLQKMSDPDPEHCPQCEAATISRLISAVGFRLKGGGWYETDFKQAGRRGGDADGGQKKDKPAADKAAEKAADKPAAKSETKSDKVGKSDTGKSATKSDSA
ncbi:MAG: FmdB family zinc ribbon protein [Gammaproteobacteria bacterium]